MRKKKTLLLFGTIISFIVTTQVAVAQVGSTNPLGSTTRADLCSVEGPPWLASIGIPCGTIISVQCLGKDASTQCGLAQIYQTIVNFTQVLLALTGSAALLMFTYGGVQWILAAGSQEKVQKGRAAMEAATIGIAIILGAWVMVNFIIWALSGGQDINAVTLFGREWFGQPSADPAVDFTIESRYP